MQQTGEIEIPTADILEGVDFRTSHYAKLLFGEGAHGWESGDDLYFRYIPEPCPASDIAEMQQLLNDACVHAEWMDIAHGFILSSEDDLDCLRQQGLGEKGPGRFRLTRRLREDPPVVHNDPEAILRERLYTALFDRAVPWLLKTVQGESVMQREVPLFSVDYRELGRTHTIDHIRATAVALFREKTGIETLQVEPSNDDRELLVFKLSSTEWARVGEKVRAGEFKQPPPSNVVQLDGIRRKLEAQQGELTR